LTTKKRVERIKKRWADSGDEPPGSKSASGKKVFGVVD